MSLPSFINSWTFYIIKLMIKKNDGQCHSLFTQIKELVFETPLLIYLTYYKDLFCQKNKYDILIYNDTNNTRKEIHCYFFFFFLLVYLLWIFTQASIVVMFLKLFFSFTHPETKGCYIEPLNRLKNPVFIFL